MSVNLVFENERKRLLGELSLKYVEFSLETISFISEHIDEFLTEFALFCLKRNSRQLLNLGICRDSVFLLDDSSNYYELSISEDISSNDTLLLFLSVRGTDRKYATNTFNFTCGRDVYGKYSRFSVTHPAKVKVRKHATEEMLKIIFETGYQWFFERTVQLAKEEEDKLGCRLYSFIKTIVHSQKLLDNLWFASITEGFGFRLLNEAVTKESFKLIKPNANKFKKSTNALVAELLNTKLPEDKLLMVNAIRHKGAIDASLMNANYLQTDSLYVATLKSLYGKNRFTVHPIYESDRVCVVALFDTKNKGVITPILERHDEELEEICKNTIGGVMQLVHKLKVGSKGFFHTVWDAFEVKPSFAGIGLDIKKIFGYFFRGKRNQ